MTVRPVQARPPAPALAAARLVCCLVLALALAAAPATAACPGRTYVSLAANGSGVIVTPGATYPEDTSCEWLLEGPAGFAITINWTLSASECNFDFLYVYDGLTVTAPLLAVHSGDTVLPPLVARSGSLRVHLFSDANYALAGLRATYAVTTLPALPVPDDTPATAAAADNGTAALASGAWARRVARASWGGRAGHTVVAVPAWGAADLWLFGGTDRNTLPAGVFAVDAETGLAAAVADQTPAGQPTPAGRFAHTATAILDGTAILVVGGVLGPQAMQPAHVAWDVELLASDAWLYNVSARAWAAMPANGSAASPPPPLAGHTATAVGDTVVILGGRTRDPPFNHDVFEYNTLTGTWARHAALDTVIAVVHHTAVYFAGTGVVYVFGGYRPAWSGYTTRSAVLQAYHPGTRRVVTLVADGPAPPRLAFHSAVLLGDLMVVHGGNRHDHYSDEQCYANTTLVYAPRCNRWLELAVAPGDPALATGRFSHAAVGAANDTLVVLGGYNGVFRADVLHWRAPAVAVEWCPLAAPASGACTRTPGCVWCNATAATNATGACVAAADAAATNGTGAFACPADAAVTAAADQCAGPCPRLTRCAACTLFAPCAWDAAAATCVVAAALSPANLSAAVTTPGACPADGAGLASRDLGAGGDAADVATAVDPSAAAAAPWTATLALAATWTVNADRFPPAAHVFVAEWRVPATAGYRFASSASGPAYVALVNTTAAPFDAAAVAMATLVVVNNSNPTGRNVFLPLGAATGSSAPVWLAAGHTYVVVAAATGLTYGAYHAVALDGAILRAPAVAPPSFAANCSAAAWQRCEVCASDTRCQWCAGNTGSGGCVARDAGPCVDAPGDLAAVTEPQACRPCEAFVDCAACTNFAGSACAWAGSRCLARGDALRLAAADATLAVATVPAACPVPCALRASCDECRRADAFDAQDNCAWCPSSQTCLAFGEITLSNSLGQCRAWARQCATCGALGATCGACFMHAECGWCSVAQSPRNGSCVAGDFDAPWSLGVNDTCGAEPGTPPAAVAAAAAYTYAACFDEDECALGTHACGNFTACANTNGSYTCPCLPGYALGGGGGGGAAVDCQPVCTNGCVHGTCVAPDTCACSVGFTGPTCATDCGCNGHSVCVNDTAAAYGVCPVCLHNTTGATCDVCAPGFFGAPQHNGTCRACDCGGLGNATLGECDPATGVCACTGYSAGARCEACLPGFYRRLGRCYADCNMTGAPAKSTAAGFHNRVWLREPRAGLGTGPALGVAVATTCLWLITAPSPRHAITLTFEADFATECDYDFVHVLDGADVGTARRLGAFSGVGAPPPVVSRTGVMAVVFYSDANYVLDGFHATYAVEACPGLCGGHGVCDAATGECACAAGFRGADCRVEECPDACGAAEGRGACVGAPGVDAVCRCAAGFAGPRCNATRDADRWYPVAAFGATAGSALPAVSGLSAVYVAAWDAAVVFGGFDLVRLTAAVRKLDFALQQWTLLADEPGAGAGPAGRHLHAAAVTDAAGSAGVASQLMLVFGGAVAEDTYTDELWAFALDTLAWTLLSGGGGINGSVGGGSGTAPPPMAGHTAVWLNGVLYVAGGLTRRYELSATVYTFTLATGAWGTLQTAAGPHPDGAYGQAGAVDGATGRLLFYGGQRLSRYDGTNTYQRLDRSTYVKVYTPAAGRWDSWSVDDDNCVASMADQACNARSSHTATVVGRYLFAFGGDRFLHGVNHNCHTNTLTALDLDCGRWIPDVYDTARGDVPLRRIAHAAVSRNGTSLVIFGGFVGSPLADVHEYVPPATFCARHTLAGPCLRDPACGWFNGTCAARAAATAAAGGNASLVTFAPACPAPVAPPRACEVATYAVSLLCDATCSVANSVLFRNTASLCDACAANPACMLCSPFPYGQGTWQANCGARAVACSPDAVTNVSVVADTNTSRCLSPCGVRKNCRDCAAAAPACGWDLHTGVCVAQNNAFGLAFTVTNESACPGPVVCEAVTSCSACNNLGCNWCESSRKCTGSLTVTTVLAFGQCLTFSGDPCVDDCAAERTCGDCTARARCGWCGHLGNNNSGGGTCEAGSPSHAGLWAPNASSPCGGVVASGDNTSTTPTTATPAASSTTTPAPAPVSWDYFGCPDIDECALSLHQCGRNASCVNLDNRVNPIRGYACTCPGDYTLAANGLDCTPVCVEGCVNGTCAAPGVCACTLGFTGATCETDCGCNGHSTCLHPEVAPCDACQNNTTGARCELCLPSFFGNATAPGDRCRSCAEVCGGHSADCKASAADPGPTCRNCANHTMGDTCNVCMPGFFIHPRLWAAAKAADFSTARAYLDAMKGAVAVECLPCQCNGHGTSCNVETGEDCDCADNTETAATACTDARAANGTCWNVQCAKCTERGQIGEQAVAQVGSPLNGGVCFVSSSTDTVYLDSVAPGATVQFSVTPRYTNVDLRLFIDTPPGRTVRVYVTNQAGVAINGSTAAGGMAGGGDLPVAASTAPADNLVFDGPLLFDERVTGRRVLSLRATDYNLGREQFYVVLQGEPAASAAGATPYRFFFVQSLVSINLFVFFAVFFSSFFLFLAGVIVAFKIRNRGQVAQQETEHALSLETMARRPMAQARLLLSRAPLSGPARVAVANLASAGVVPVVPVAAQPLATVPAAVATVLVDLPARPPRRHMVLGSALVSAAVMQQARVPGSGGEDGDGAAPDGLRRRTRQADTAL